MVSKDEWTKLANLTDLELALDNLVAAYACFWPGDHSMVTLRRVVTKTKSFSAISSQENRMKMLEIFINQILEVNQRRAIQDEVPMTYKEVMEVARDKLENVADYIRPPATREYNGGGAWRGSNSGRRTGGREPRQFTGGAEATVDQQKEQVKRILRGQKIYGKDFCLDYNVASEDGNPRCKSRSCRHAHNCAYVVKGESKACGKRHSKVEHFKVLDVKKEK